MLFSLPGYARVGNMDMPLDGFLAERIANGDSCAVEQLYGIIFKAAWPVLNGRLRDQDPGDFLHETLTIVVEAVRNRELRNPESLRAYIQSVIRRHGAACIVRNISSRRRMVDFDSAIESAKSPDNPETAVLDQERSDLIARGLKRLRSRDSELLTRFYIYGEPFREICRDMNLTETQFRLFKSRAKAKLTAWAREQ